MFIREKVQLVFTASTAHSKHIHADVAEPVSNCVVWIGDSDVVWSGDFPGYSTLQSTSCGIPE